MNTEPWITAIDVARHLGVVKDTVYLWRERKGLPAHKIGQPWKCQLSEVDAWVRAAQMRIRIIPCSKNNKGEQF